MKRLRIVHSTGYRYDGDVTASHNEARMLPVTGERQLPGGWIDTGQSMQ